MSEQRVGSRQGAGLVTVIDAVLLGEIDERRRGDRRMAAAHVGA